MSVTTQQPTQTIGVTSELMQNYRLGKPFVPGSRIATAFNQATGLTELFTVSTSGRLLNLHADSSSDTGWSVVDMNFTTSVFDACDRLDGSLIVYALDGSGIIHTNTKTAGQWQGWDVTLQPTMDPRFVPNYSFTAVIDLKAHRFVNTGYYGTNETSLSALCKVTDIHGNSMNVPATYYPSSNHPGWGWSWGEMVDTNDWCPGFVASNSWMVFYNGVYTSGTFPALEWDPMYGGGAVPGGTGIQQWRCEVNDHASVFRLLDAFGSYTGLVTSSGWQTAAGFAYGESDELFALRTPGPNTNGGPTLAYHLHLDTTSWVFSPRKLGDIPVSTIAVRTMNPGPDARIELFAVGTDKFLYHCRQTDDNRDNWTPLLRLEQDTPFHQVIAGRDPGLYSEVFAVSTDARLFHIWQGAADDSWHYDEVELADASAAIEEISTYSLQLTVYDAQQVPVNGQTVKIFSDAPALLDVNGFTCYVRPGLPWECQSLANGQVTIVAQVDTLGAPRLSAWTSSMPADDRVVLEASAPLRDRLAAVDQNALLQAKVTDNTGGQTNLLTGDTVNAASDLANVVKQSMGMAAKVATPPTAPAYLRFFHRTNDHRVARYVAAGGSGALPAMVAPQPFGVIWQVDFSSGRPVYSELTAEQAHTTLAEMRALPSFAETGLSSDWGSLWDLITEGAAALVGWVVDGLSVTMHLIIDGVKYVYNAIVTLVEQAFDLLEEVFRAIKVMFQDLFRWLAHIFGWDDIRRTQAAIEHTWQQGVLFTESLVRKLSEIATSVDGPINRAKQDIDTQFEDWIKVILPQNPSLSSLQTTTKPPPNTETKVRQSSAVNVFQSGIMNSNVTVSANMPAFAGLQLAAEQMIVLDDFVTALTTQTDAATSTNAFTQAQAYFASIADHPDQLLQLLISAILETFKGLALLALEAAQSLIASFCKAALLILDQLWGLLTQPVNLPFVSDLYTFITTDENHPNGEELTLLNLVALIIATPATILHKLFVGNTSFPDNNPSGAPFPTDASLQNFKASFTASWLEQQAGLSSASEEVSTLVAAPEIDYKALQIAFKAILLATSTVNIYTNVRLDQEAMEGIDSSALLTVLGLAESWLSWVFLVPWADGTSIPPNFSAQGLPRLIWCLKGSLPLMDAIIFGISKCTKITRSFLPIAHGIYGCTSVVGVIAVGIVGGYADNKYAILEDLFAAIPDALKFLIMVRDCPQCGLVLGIGDVVCDIVAWICSIYELFNAAGAV